MLLRACKLRWSRLMLRWRRTCPLPSRRILRLSLFVYFFLLLLYIISEIRWLQHFGHSENDVVNGNTRNCSSGLFSKFWNQLPSEEVDVVYTWVNGSDHRLQTSLRDTANQLMFDELHSTCSFSLHQLWLNSTALLLPVALVRPPLPFASRYVSNVRLVETFNTSASLLYFDNINSARQQLSECVRMIDGRVYKLSALFMSSHKLDRKEDKLNISQLIRITRVEKKVDNNATTTTTTGTVEEFGFGHIGKRKHLRLIGTRLDDDGNTQAYYHVGDKTNLVNKTIEWIETFANKNVSNFRVDHPAEVSLADANFFRRPMDENENSRPNRFADNDELRYSLRSLEKNAPWVKNIYLVTNGQIPRWLNVDHPQIRIVQHKDIYPNQSHLPTFSSSSIETHLHLIPGLSRQFLYINDDILLGRPVWPEDFYTRSEGHKVYLAWSVPECSLGCPMSWLQDKHCDRNCDTARCLFDGGDCLNKTTTDPKDSTGSSHSSWFSQTHQTNNNEDAEQCASSCQLNWLGDGFCDQVCNEEACAFDMADCELANYAHLPVITIEPYLQTYAYPIDKVSIVLNMTNIISFEYNSIRIESNIKAATLIESTSVYQAVYSPKHQVLTILFSKTSKVRSKFSVEFEAELDEHNMNFTVHLVPENVNNSEKAETSTNVYIFQFIEQQLNATKEMLTSLQANHTLDNDKPHQLTNVHITPEEMPAECNISTIELAGKHPKFQRFEADYRAGLWTQSGHKSMAIAMHRLLCNILLNNTLSDNVTSPSIDDPLLQFLQNKYQLPRRGMGRHLLDSYADSLVHVNMIYFQRFGKPSEHSLAIAHMPHFIDCNIMVRLQRQFEEYFELTSSHRFRSNDDMQFAFSYFYYLMNEKTKRTLEEILSQFDADNTRSLSWNECITLLANLHEELDSKHEKLFVESILACTTTDHIRSHQIDPYVSLNQSGIFPLPFSFFEECHNVSQTILNALETVPTNRFERIYTETDMKTESPVTFVMLRSDLAELKRKLNKLRKDRKKFICLNDNFEYEKMNAFEARLVRRELELFYTSFYPMPSQYELPIDQENEHLNIEDYRRHQFQIRKSWFLNIHFSYVFLIFNIILLLFIIL